MFKEEFSKPLIFGQIRYKFSFYHLTFVKFDLKKVSNPLIEKPYGLALMICRKMKYYVQYPYYIIASLEWLTHSAFILVISPYIIFSKDNSHQWSLNHYLLGSIS